MPVDGFERFCIDLREGVQRNFSSNGYIRLGEQVTGLPPPEEHASSVELL